MTALNDQSPNPSPEAEEYQIKLLEERLKIERTRRKIGEVIIRKEIEIHTVEIPVRQEKLIIEQVGTETKRLAEVTLSQETISGVEILETPQTNPVATVNGKFSSLEQAIEILALIARQPPHGCTQVEVKLCLEDSKFQPTYEIMFQQYAESELYNRSQESGDRRQQIE